MTNYPWSPEFGTKFHREVPVFLEVPEFLFNTLQDRSKDAPVPKPGSIHSAVSIEHQLVTGRQRAIASIRASIASRG